MNYTIFETFVGAGGSHIGFKKQGFISKYVNDFSHEAMETLLINNPEIRHTAVIDESSILDTNPIEILKKTNMKVGDLDVLFGGIVCKGFSLAGERSPNDERNYFYHKQLELVDIIRPKVSIIENVPGIKTAKVLSLSTPKDIKHKVNDLWKKIENYKGEKSILRKTNRITEEFELKGKNLRIEKEKMLKTLKSRNYLKSVYQDIIDLYTNLGYRVYAQFLNSACYGAATKRERLIIVAVREDINIEYMFPEATHGNEIMKKKYPYLYKDDKKYNPIKTVNDALSEINYLREDKDNIPMNHNEKTIERFKYIPEGENIAKHMDKVPANLQISRFYSRGNTMRLNSNDASPTLVPGHSNFPIHPKEHRSITVREAATITGFPVDYVFVGSHTKRCESVGNAVPPALSEAIARSVRTLLDAYKNDLDGRF
ncbi:MAG: DNA cytosine methyltransferase [Erysipelotrichaceae bacterium]|nr:DNA cytosine methyltransferase [Erysipelotrichaceae bacterium]